MNTFFENVKKSEEKTPAASNKFGFGFGKVKHSSPYSQAKPPAKSIKNLVE